MPHDYPLSERLHQGVIFLLLLVCADSVFVIFHLVHKLSPFLADKSYSLGTDGGYSEIFQYLKTYWIVIMLGALWWRSRDCVYVGWMLLYAYLLADDALKIHERGGAAIARYGGFQSALGLRAVDFGELAVSGAVGLVLLSSILVLYLRSTRAARNASQDLALLLGILVFFGVIVDMVEMVVVGGYVGGFFGLVEDGGEMFAMTLVCWCVFILLERRGITPIPLWQLTTTVLAARLKVAYKPG